MNQKGFTLVELLATLLIIGVVMGITIPNVTGIFNQGKITTYAEDAKKMRTSAEYMFRGNNEITKPVENNECIVVSLKYLNNEEYKAPYGGKYLDNKSFVVIRKVNTATVKKYYYYVQLIEQLPDGGYRGFQLVDATLLDADGYFDRVNEFSTDTFVDVSGYVSNPNGLNLNSINCSRVLKVYTPTT